VRVALITLLLWSMGALAAPPSTKEYEIKAAFVYNFTKFVEWPPETFVGPQAPLVIGVLGESPCAAALTAIVKDHQVNGRPLLVKVVVTMEEARTAQVLFVSSSQEARFAQLAAQLHATPLLTVGESAEFAQAGGMINFVLLEDKIRFEINMQSAESAGLKVSSQLQKLATRVRRSP
jgi:hypothetical protein